MTTLILEKLNQINQRNSKIRLPSVYEFSSLKFVLFSLPPNEAIMPKHGLKINYDHVLAFLWPL